MRPLFPKDRVHTCSAGDVSEYFGSVSPILGYFFLSKEGLIYSNGDFFLVDLNSGPR
jgi:hypothetical protein